MMKRQIEKKAPQQKAPQKRQVRSSNSASNAGSSVPEGFRVGTAFFEVLAQEAIMGIMAFEPTERRCVFVNNLGREILEIHAVGEQIVLPLLTDLFADEARGNLRPFSDEIVRREGLTQDVLVRKSNGLTFIANVGVKYIHVDDGEPILLVMFQDITFQKKLQRELTLKQEEIHKAYAELLDQNRQLRELDMAKDKFIALTTHELRTPLSAIVATAEVLQLKLYESEEQKEAFITTIHEQGMHLMELVNDVLDFAKMRAGKMEFYVDHADIRLLLAKVVANFESMAEQAGVTLQLDLPPDEANCYFDWLRMSEIANNVVSNAIKYNRRNGSVRITISTNSDFTRVTVQDTGLGIPADKIASVFNEFETVGHVSRHHKGTGLGMPISKRLIEAMGGHLTLESEVGTGTRFHIDIPNNKVLPAEMYGTRPDAWGDLAAS